MAQIKCALPLALVLLLLFSESLPSSAHESSLNPRSGVVGEKMQEGRTRPANDDRSLFHKNRELFGVIAGAIDAAKAARAAKAAAKAGITAAKVAASPSQILSLRLGYFLFLCLYFFL